jgi:hypothetical protein
VTAKRRGRRPQLLNAIREEQAAFYRSLVAAEAGLGVFLKGWLNRPPHEPHQPDADGRAVPVS